MPDRRVEALSDQHIAANAAAGNPISLVRAEHRREHLDEIERVFAPSRCVRDGQRSSGVT
jgi:hypothetical protein